MTAEKLCVSKPASCSEHADRASELYCPKHGAAICHLCASSVHRACPEVILFDKRVQELTGELAELSETLKAAEKKLERAILDLDHKQKEAEEKTTQVLVQIEEACNRLKNSVEACRKRLKELALHSKKKVTKSFEKTKEGLIDRQRQIISHRLLVIRVRLTSPPGKLESTVATVKSRVKDVDLDIEPDFTVVPDECVRVDFGVVTRLEREMTFLGEKHLPRASPEETIWKFCDKAKNVIYSNSWKTAERLRGKSAIVFSNSPMQKDVLYEVSIDEIRGKSADVFPCGVVEVVPDVIPESVLEGWNKGIVFSNAVYMFGKQKGQDTKDCLKNLPEGTRVGMLRDSGNFLHLYINGERQWVFVRPAPSPCYAFFELLHIYRKISALPPTVIKRALKKTKSICNLIDL